MFCTKCGAQLPGDSRFCNYCSNALESPKTPGLADAPHAGETSMADSITKKADIIKENPLGSEKIGKLMLKYVPLTIALYLLDATYTVVDRIIVGGTVGYYGIAAISIVFPMFTIVAAFSFMFGIGAASSFNLSLGAGDREKAEKTAGSGLSVAVLSGIAMTVIYLVLLSPILSLFGATESIFPFAKAYASLVVFGIPFQMFTIVGCFIIRADGRPGSALLCMLSGAIFNLLFDWAFIFKFHWGITGAALATVFGQALSAALVLFFVVRRMKNVRLTKKSIRPSAAITKTICSLGLSGFTTHIAMALVTIALNNTVSYYGSDLSITAISIVQAISTIFTAFIFGIGHGCQPIYSFNYGSMNYARVKESLKKSLVFSLLLGVLFFAIIQLIPRLFIGIFTQDYEVLQLAPRFLRILMFMIFVNGVQEISPIYFSATGRAVMGVFLALSRRIVFLIPLLMLLPPTMGIDGILFASPVSDAVSAILIGAIIIMEFKKLNGPEIGLAVPQQTAAMFAALFGSVACIVFLFLKWVNIPAIGYLGGESRISIFQISAYIQNSYDVLGSYAGNDSVRIAAIALVVVTVASIILYAISAVLIAAGSRSSRATGTFASVLLLVVFLALQVSVISINNDISSYSYGYMDSVMSLTEVAYIAAIVAVLSIAFVMQATKRRNIGG